MKQMQPRIAVTMGDPAGIGPELCLRVLADIHVLRTAIPLVIGDHGVLAQVAEQCQLPWTAQLIDSQDEAVELPVGPAVWHVGGLPREGWRPGATGAVTGRASYRYIETAIELALQGRVQGVTTGPIQKQALQQAGIEFPGHTEIFASKTQSDRVCMMLTSPAITCSLVTTHIGLREVAEKLTTESILQTIELTHESLAQWRGRPPSLCVCGLNPHAGEVAQFGMGEEERVIAPAVQQAKSLGILVEGPVPPDTAFIPARRERTDAYICMYHDQGLIPLKALAFDSAVNVTLGLPIVRTSVDHGTALDIAWQGQADGSSMIAAVKLAAKIASGTK